MSNLELGRKRAAELGLRAANIGARRDSSFLYAYTAEDIHRLLGAGRVFGFRADPVYELNQAHNFLCAYPENPNGDVDDLSPYRALLIGAHQVVAESAERKMLRAMIKWWDDPGDSSDPNRLIREAKELLERKETK